MKYLILTALFLSACTKHKGLKNNQVDHHKAQNHTQKLIRGLSVSFISEDQVLVKSGVEDIENIKIKIFHKSNEGKTLVHEESIDKAGFVSFNLDKSLRVDGQTLAAVVNATDSKSQTLSSVSTYIIGHQEEINSLKSNKLKN